MGLHFNITANNDLHIRSTPHRTTIIKLVLFGGFDINIGECTSSESSGFSFALHELEHIADSDWAFHIADQMPFVGLFAGD